MDLGYHFDLLNDVVSDVVESCWSDRPIDPEQAYPRPVTARASAGDLLCQASLGSLMSVMTIDPRICGSVDGCHGKWHCLTGKSAFDQAQYNLPLSD